MVRIQAVAGAVRRDPGARWVKWMARSSSLALAIGFAAPALAQVSESAPAGGQTTTPAEGSAPNQATSSSNQIGDVVVTARRVTERLQDIPASVSAITGDQVERMNTLSDIQSMVSGVTFKNYGPIPIVGIRGFGNRSVAGTAAQSTVGIFQDGVFVSPTLVVLANRVDSERVEVAKGPQSTLYGRASFVGAINIVSNDPAKVFSGYLDGGYGGSSVHGENLWHLRAAVSVPLNDTLSVRFFGLREKRDGFVYDPVTGNRSAGYDRTIGRVRLLWEPSDAVTARLTGTIMHDNLPLGLVHSGRNPAPLGQTILFGDYVVPTIAPIVGSLLQFGKTVWDGTLAQPVSGRTKAEQVTLDLRFKTPIGELASLTDYQHSYQDLHTDLDLTRLGLALGDTPTNDHRYSEELRLSNKTGNFSYLFGLYLLHTVTAVAGGGAPDPAHPTNTFGFGSIQFDVLKALYQYSPSYTRGQAYAAFGQVGYDFTDRLNLTVGVRQGHDDFSGTAGAFLQSVTGVLTTTTPITYRKAAFNATTGSANLSYKVAPDVIVYGSFARGDSPGGLNTGALATTPFSPQKVNAYELGLKSQLLNRHLQFNVALFDNDYKQLQLTQNLQINGANVAYISNAASARGRGVDLDAVVVLTSSLRLGAQYTYADSKITSYNVPAPPAPQVNLVGIPLVRSPKHSANGSATFTHDIGPGKFLFTGEESYTSSYNNDYQGSPIVMAGVTTGQVLGLFRTPGYAVTNLNASYTVGPVEVSGYVRNLFNHQYIVGVLGFSNTIYPQELPGEPRTFEVSVKYKF